MLLIAGLIVLAVVIVIIILVKSSQAPAPSLITQEDITQKIGTPIPSDIQLEATAPSPVPSPYLIKASPIPQTFPSVIAAATPFPTCTQPPITPFVMPTPPPVESGKEPVSGERTHVVQPNEILSKIASLYYGDGKKYFIIIEANKDTYPELEKNPNIIKPGWILRIPYLEEERK